MAVVEGRVEHRLNVPWGEFDVAIPGPTYWHATGEAR